MASSNQPKYHMLNTTPCWSYWKYEVAMGTGTVTGGIFPSSGFLIGVRLSSASAARLTPLAVVRRRAQSVRSHLNPCDQQFFNLD